MMIRRVSALLMALLTVQLNVQSVAAACSTNRSHAKNAAATHPKTSAHHHQPIAALQEVEQNQAPCEAPLRAVCCQAMTSCSGNLFSSGTSTSVATRREVLLVARYALQFPSSRIAAPEPPPPKA